ncbi:BglII/BstYI family type II restriction endonuclease [uncultured Oscillibacter sp.]|uniref:BglII/BstYI family type II restriction endonuclease n=1 Tax=uncultured Oscillibacter sp. TaxID=876091 RepID=UPI00260B4765|nr:BglII/BstYI family type II restriction endonuclease [uncultured Oscillibacter sp.]
MDRWMELIPETIRSRYDLYNFNSAVEILSQTHVNAFAEIMDTLDRFQMELSDISEKGGNESNVPKKLSALLRPLGWNETEIAGDLVVRLLEGKSRKAPSREFQLSDFISGHKIDYVKGEVAVDLEWNSKDQTFDRDLYAFRTFFECGVISCGVLITRSERLNTVFDFLGYEVKKKYGASTTWMGKLLPRIHARRHGGCPLLVVGITPETISDWKGE